MLLVLLLVLIGCSSSENGNTALDRIYDTDPQRVYIGEAVADIHFLNIVSGEQIHLDDLYKNKIVIIETFSNGCPACVEGIKKYNPLFDTFNDELELVYLGIEPTDTAEAILTTKEENGGGNWIWTAHQGNLIPFYEQYNLHFNDMTMIIDTSGKIVYADSFTVPVDRLMAELAKVGVQ